MSAWYVFIVFHQATQDLNLLISKLAIARSFETMLETLYRGLIVVGYNCIAPGIWDRHSARILNIRRRNLRRQKSSRQSEMRSKQQISGEVIRRSHQIVRKELLVLCVPVMVVTAGMAAMC